MPLPKSLTCGSCKHTYPEGWVRCPYCGFEPGKEKRDRQIERALVKRFPSYAAAVSTNRNRRKKPTRDDRAQNPEGRPSREQQGKSDGTTEGARKRSRRRRGRGRKGATSGPSPTADASTAPKKQPRGDQNAPRPRNDQPANRGESKTQQSAGSQGETSPKRARRRRPRRRRKPGEGARTPGASTPDGGTPSGGTPHSDS